jgi:hypothetical protein
MSHRAPQDAILDPTPRVATTQVEVLRDEPNRRYKVIAGLNAYYDTADGGAPVDNLVCDHPRPSSKDLACLNELDEWG